ncbi:hypothetical protein KPP03845_200037 (plasmid) [Streptomyces xanthophaeus]|uniref:hypothetical protein n=1 Tax=Streptomyces xanthophaeus TaxID=67385 RepID=UPI00233E8A8C|nr:hypothetical protein [Streptomyces xanthophaeus]WCD91076.1 hypothetical protein KPP03845_200037 [Streptomyces xanthophaeus]
MLATACPTVIIMLRNPWFEIDDPDDEFGFDEAELAFATALREQAKSWDVPYAHSWVGRPEDDSSLLAFVGLSDKHRRVSLIDIGVHLVGSSVRGDRLHNQLYFLPDQPTSLAMEAVGSPQELAERTATWFETLLRKPIVRHEWEHSGQIYASRYLFADTGQGLSQSYNQTLAPSGQAEALINAGHVQGRGWIQTSGLGRPDRIVNIRGEATA